jgi:hypothetical protein
MEREPEEGDSGEQSRSCSKDAETDHRCDVAQYETRQTLDDRPLAQSNLLQGSHLEFLDRVFNSQDHRLEIGNLADRVLGG